jgi:nucleotide-binding universal stress UspA family protein
MKIMVGYDGSKVAGDALTLARKHAKSFDAKVYLVTSLVKGTKKNLQEIIEAEKGLENAQATFKEDAVPSETHLLVRGLSPGEDLVQFARKHDVDEIIVGVRRRSKVGKLILGSTAQHVILNAHCPVIAVK